MAETWILTKRELRAYFDGPAAYVVLIVFLGITGWFFASPFFLQNEATLRPMFSIASFVFLFFVPALTMSSFAEERRSGTLELLLTFPVQDWQVILGKLIAVALLLLVGIGMTFVNLITVAALGDIDLGATIGGYLGLFLLGITYGAIGICASSLTRNLIVAFLLGFGSSFAFYLFDKVVNFVPSWLGGVLQQLSTDYHFENLLRGVIDSRDVLFYLSLAGFAFLITIYNLAKRPE